jgi:hypothetical protein
MYMAQVSCVTLLSNLQNAARYGTENQGTKRRLRQSLAQLVEDEISDFYMTTQRYLNDLARD